MRILLILICGLLAFLPASCVALSTQNSPISKATTAKKQTTLTPQEILNRLRQGNYRFVNGQMRDYDYAKEMKITSKQGQHPIAFILSCIDSRSIPDILFDQGLGNIFVARVAGNVVGKSILGSMEFATEIAGSRLIVVMGHNNCGAIKGACSGKASGNLQYLLNKIKPAVNTVKKREASQFSCSNIPTIDEITKQNVINQIQFILKKSSVIRRLVANKKIEVVGAMHNIRTGKVVFFDMNANLL